MVCGPHFIISTMQAGTTPIFNGFGMTGPSSNRESNPQNLLVSARSSLSWPFTISRGYWGPIRHQGAPSEALTLDASRALTDTESRYAIIEKEMLAIVFALEKCHQFTYGRPVIVHSDHKPLHAITRKPLDRAPKRLQSMLILALAYDIEVNYLKKILLADTLSRAYMKDTKYKQEELETVNAVNYLPMQAEKIADIRAKTKEDNVQSSLKTTIQQGWPEQDEVLNLIK